MKPPSGRNAVDHPLAATSAVGRVRSLTFSSLQHRSQCSELKARAASHASASSSAPTPQTSSPLGVGLPDCGRSDRAGRQQAVSRYARLQSRRRNVSRSADWPVRPLAASGNAERSHSPPPPPARGLGLASGIAGSAAVRQGSRSDTQAQSLGSGAAVSSDAPGGLVGQASQGPTCQWPGGPACPWPGGTKAITLDQLSKNNPQTMQALAQTAKEKQPGGTNQPNIGTFWALLVLGFAYLHHSTTG